VKALLDTHAVVWAAESDSRLGSEASALLQSLKAGEAVISDLSLLEIAMLAKKGRVALRVPIRNYLNDLQKHFPVLPVTSDIAASAMELELPPGDPFDRVIVATARHHKLPLLTRDRNIVASGLVRTVW